MSLGGQAMGLAVETNEFRPTKIEGNPEHPWSLGATRGFHQASVLVALRRLAERRRVISDGKASNWKSFAAYSRLQGQFGNGANLRFLSEPINSPSFKAAVKACT
jgi:hypothetical protein